jgi:hypothetical protein
MDDKKYIDASEYQISFVEVTKDGNTYLVSRNGNEFKNESAFMSGPVLVRGLNNELYLLNKDGSKQPVEIKPTQTLEDDGMGV